MGFTDVNPEYENLEDYFRDHPEEEDEFVDELARLEEERFVELPEDYRYA